MKKTTILATVLALSLSLSAGATGTSATTSPDQVYQGVTTVSAGYTGTISVNGSVLSTAALPASPTTVTVPLRAIVEADGGYAEWFAGDNLCVFGFGDYTIDIDVATGKIMVNWVDSGLKASFINGTTFVPVSLFSKMDGYTGKQSGANLTITTPNSLITTKTAKEIISTLNMAASMKASATEMESFYGLTAANFDEVVGYFPMMINADTVIIGKVKSGKMDEVKTQLEAIRAQTQSNFTNYLPGPEEMAKNGQIVTDGDYVMLIISSDNAKASTLFKAAV